MEGDGVFGGGEVGFLGEVFYGFEALMFVAGGLGGVAGEAAVGGGEAVGFGGVGFFEVALGESVEGE